MLPSDFDLCDWLEKMTWASQFLFLRNLELKNRSSGMIEDAVKYSCFPRDSDEPQWAVTIFNVKLEGWG